MCKLTQTQVKFNGCSQGSFLPPSTCTLTAQQLPWPFCLRLSSITSPQDLYPSPFLPVQYFYSNRDAMLCIYQCEQLSILQIIYTKVYICVYTCTFKLLILHLLFIPALEGSLKRGFGDLGMLTIEQEWVHKAPCSRDSIPLCYSLSLQHRCDTTSTE